MSNKFEIFKSGILDISPLLIPVIPFGIIFGAIGIEMGFTPTITYATSLIIFGGASQIVFIQLLSGGASSLIAVTSVGVVNSRHFLYGAVLTEYLEKLTLTKKLLLSYIITDQTFAVSNIYLKKNKSNQYNYYHLIGSGITLWLTWQISTILGIFLGSIVPDELGLKFAIPLTFIAIIINEFRKLDHVLIMVISGISSLIFFNIPFKAYVIVSPLIGLFIAWMIILFRGKK
tara:strand:+ start:97 stop:789 length:693 start_codon:yes stop_codon:yes gene_type:complete